jgi:hypothetical protein
MMPHLIDHCYYTTNSWVKSMHCIGMIQQLGLVQRILAAARRRLRSSNSASAYLSQSM